MTRAMLERFRFPNEIVGTAEHLVRQHMYSPIRPTDAACDASSGDRPENIERLFDLRQADIRGSGLPKRDDANEAFEARVARRVGAQTRRFPCANLTVDGDDVIARTRAREATAARISRATRRVGAALHWLFEQVTDEPERNERTLLLQRSSSFSTRAQRLDRRRSLSRIIALVNQKGGVGKSTTAVNLGAALAMLGSRVLVVDSDPQGNTTTGLGIDKGRLTHDIYHALMQEIPLENVLVRTEIENLMLAPATINLAGADVELVAALSRETRLRQALAPVAGAIRFRADRFAAVAGLTDDQRAHRRGRLPHSRAGRVLRSRRSGTADQRDLARARRTQSDAARQRRARHDVRRPHAFGARSDSTNSRSSFPNKFSRRRFRVTCGSPRHRHTASRCFSSI